MVRNEYHVVCLLQMKSFARYLSCEIAQDDCVVSNHLLMGSMMHEGLPQAPALLSIQGRA